MLELKSIRSGAPSRDGPSQLQGGHSSRSRLPEILHLRDKTRYVQTQIGVLLRYDALKMPLGSPPQTASSTLIAQVPLQQSGSRLNQAL